MKNLRAIILEEIKRALEETFAGKKELDNDGDDVPKWADKDDNDPKVGSKSSKTKGGKVPPQLQKFVKSKKTGKEELEALKEYVMEARQNIPQDSEIQNEVDNIANLINQTLFLLRFP